MRVFFDTNIILDVLQARPNFYPDAVALYSQVEQKQLVGLLSATSLTDIAYLVEFHFHRVLGRSKREAQFAARAAIHKLIKVFEIAPVGSGICGEADASKFSDFEDAVQYYCAIQAMATHIVTRNKRDFATMFLGPIKICDPVELRSILLIT